MAIDFQRSSTTPYKSDHYISLKPRRDHKILNHLYVDWVEVMISQSNVKERKLFIQAQSVDIICQFNYDIVEGALADPIESLDTYAAIVNITKKLILDHTLDEIIELKPCFH